MTKRRRSVAVAKLLAMNASAASHIDSIAVRLHVMKIDASILRLKETFSDDQKWLAMPNECTF